MKPTEKDGGSYRNPTGGKLEPFGGLEAKSGTYNMMDETRAPVESGSVMDALYKKSALGNKSNALVEAPKVSSVGVKFAQAFSNVGGSSGVSVLGDPSKWKRPKKTLVLFEYEGSPFW